MQVDSSYHLSLILKKITQNNNLLRTNPRRLKIMTWDLRILDEALWDF